LHPKSGERALLRNNVDSFYALLLAAKLSLSVPVRPRG
jgi:hypothetical protein